MSRKRKRSYFDTQKCDKKKGGNHRTTDRDRTIAKLIVNSIWRLKTADTETTTRGNEKLSGWKRCVVLERLATSDEYPQGSVRVKYFEDKEEEEPCTYDILEFIANAAPAPCHVDLTRDVGASVSREQPVFEMPERPELLPVQLKKKAVRKRG